MTDAGDVLPRGTRLDELEIERVLGAGGFGVTYLARDVSLDAWRAVKEYLPRGLRGADGRRDGRAANGVRCRGLPVGPGAVSGGSADSRAFRSPQPGAGASGDRGVGHGVHGDGVCEGSDAEGRGEGGGSVVGVSTAVDALGADGGTVGSARGGRAAPRHRSGQRDHPSGRGRRC